MAVHGDIAESGIGKVLRQGCGRIHGHIADPPGPFHPPGILRISRLADNQKTAPRTQHPCHLRESARKVFPEIYRFKSNCCIESLRGAGKAVGRPLFDEAADAQFPAVAASRKRHALGRRVDPAGDAIGTQLEDASQHGTAPAPDVERPPRRLPRQERQAPAVERGVPAVHSAQHEAAPEAFGEAGMPQKSVKKRVLSHNRPKFAPDGCIAIRHGKGRAFLPTPQYPEMRIFDTGRTGCACGKRAPPGDQ